MDPFEEKLLRKADEIKFEVLKELQLGKTNAPDVNQKRNSFRFFGYLESDEAIYRINDISDAALKMVKLNHDEKDNFKTFEYLPTLLCTSLEKTCEIDRETSENAYKNGPFGSIK